MSTQNHILVHEIRVLQGTPVCPAEADQHKTCAGQAHWQTDRQTKKQTENGEMTTNVSLLSQATLTVVARSFLEDEMESNISALTVN